MRDIERIINSARIEVNASLKAAKNEETSHLGALFCKARSEELWNFLWITVVTDEKAAEELRKEWNGYSKEFEKILAEK